MKSKFKLLFCIIVLYLIGSPTFSTGFDEVNVFKSILQLILYLGIFLAVIIFSILGTRFIAKNYKRVVSSKYIDLLDVLNLPGGSRIAIVKIDKKIYILSINNNSTTIIDKIDKDEFNLFEVNFDNYLEKYFDKWNINFKSSKLLSKFNLKKDKEDINNEE